MGRHPVSFDNLIDWCEGRLEASRRTLIDQHLARGCIRCEADIAWLGRVILASRSDDSVEPPAELVGQVMALGQEPFRRATGPWSRPWHRSWQLTLAVAVLMVLLVSSALFMLQQPSFTPRVATLISVSGSVLLQKPSQTQWKRAALGDRLNEGTKVWTPDGQASLILFDGSHIGLRSGAEIVLSSLRSSLLGARCRIELGQRAGYVEYTASDLRGRRSSFQVRSPTALISVVDTRFAVAVESDMVTRVLISEGSLLVASSQGSARLTTGETALIGTQGAIELLPTVTPSDQAPGVSATPSATPSPKGALPSPSATRTLTPSATPSITAMPSLRPTPSESALESAPTSTPRPSETPKPAAEPTEGSTSTRTPAPKKSSTSTRPPEPSETPRVEPSPPPHAEEPTDTPQPTTSPEPTHSPEGTRTGCPTEAPCDLFTPTARPTRTRAPTLTATLEPSHTPHSTSSPNPSELPLSSQTPRATSPPTVTPPAERSPTPQPTPSRKPTEEGDDPEGAPRHRQSQAMTFLATACWMSQTFDRCAHRG